MSGPESLSFQSWLVDLRRHFHQYPELAWKEEKTAGKIGEVLRQLGIEFEARIGGTGIVASLDASRPGPTLALRADMDALPIEEKNDVPYRSRIPGVMHACGHDGHVTMVLGTARYLLESGWKERGSGRLLFIFQPAEEGGAGARAMLESGIFDTERVSAIFTGHMHPDLPSGQIGMAEKVCNAASDSFSIRLVGKGGHGAHPHLCIDPIVAGAYLVTQVQSIIARSVPPLESVVVTIGKFHAGSARNVIPEEAVLEGTVRTLDRNVRELVLERLGEIIRGVETSHRVFSDFTLGIGYPLLVNDANLVAYVLKTARESLGESNVHIEEPRMGAEDFAYFANRWPGVLVRVGCRKPGTEYEHGLHSPWFDFDEATLEYGVRLFAALLTGYGFVHTGSR